jgi:hypothetical protein
MGLVAGLQQAEVPAVRRGCLGIGICGGKDAATCRVETE